MTTHMTKQQIHGGSEYHQRRHDDAQARIAEFAALREAGLTLDEIGARYNVTGEAVRKALKRAEGRMK